jgi:hypothetical protein
MSRYLAATSRDEVDERGAISEPPFSRNDDLDETRCGRGADEVRTRFGRAPLSKLESASVRFEAGAQEGLAGSK